MGNRKKSINKGSSSLKQGMGARSDQIHSSNQKLRSSKKNRRKSLKVMDSANVPLQNEIQQTLQKQTQNQQNSRSLGRPMTLSPQKLQRVQNSPYKLDSSYKISGQLIQEQFQSFTESPANKTTGIQLASNGESNNNIQSSIKSTIPAKDTKMFSSSLSNSNASPIKIGGSLQPNSQRESQLGSIGIKTLMPMAQNIPTNKIQQQASSNPSHSQHLALLQADKSQAALSKGNELIGLNQTTSPIHSNASYHNQPGNTIYHLVPKNALNMNNGVNQNVQFQHVLAQKQVQQHFTGLTGLLNMSKQRGLLNGHPPQQQQHQQQQQQQLHVINRNQNGQARAGSVTNNSHKQGANNNNNVMTLQNNGRIIAQKMPIYTQQNTLPVQQFQHSQTLPLSIFDMQVLQNQGEQQSRMFNKAGNYHLTQQQAQQQQQLFQQQQIMLAQHGHLQNGYSFVSAKQKGGPSMIGASSPQYIVAKKQQSVNIGGGGGSFPNQQQMYYYDSPVQISGKQLGLPVTYPKQFDKNMVKKVVSAGNINTYASITGQGPSNLTYDYQIIQNDHLARQMQQQQLFRDDYTNQQIFFNQQHQQQQQLISYQSYEPRTNNEIQPLSASKQNALVSAAAAGAKKQSKIPFANAYVEDCYKYIVVAGNNSGLIRKAMERRDWWIEIPAVHSLYNFKWQPVSCGIKYERLSPMKAKPGEIGGSTQYSTQSSNNNNNNNNGQADNVQTRQLVNHLEYHHLISEKANLFNIMTQHCESMKENVFDLLPLTFFVEVPDVEKVAAYNQSMAQFTQFYQTLEDNKNKVHQMKEMLINPPLPENEPKVPLNKGSGQQLSIKQTKFKAFNFDKRTSTKFSFPLSHFDGFNLWLLKPTHLNRGRGIHVFRDLESLHKLIKEYCMGKDEETKTTQKKESVGGSGENGPKDESPDENTAGEDNANSPNLQANANGGKAKVSASPKKSNNNYKIKHNTFIIQKYIERPLLLCKRKFDIRQWVLINQDNDVFFFKEGYLRTSSSTYQIDLSNIDNQYVHLTNNAVQQFAENYGDFEDGNQLNYNRFQEILDQEMPDAKVRVREHIIPQMKEQVIKSIFAVRKKLDPFKRKHTFEMFGYDFILDEDFNVWLIEINTNPCIEESSQILKIYLPRMIEDMLKLTVDQMFPKIKKKKNKKSVTGSPQKSSIQNKINSQNPNGVSILEKIEEEMHTQTFESNTVRQDQQSIEDPLKQQNVENGADQSSSNGQRQSRIHHVPGYTDTENMWEKIWNMEKSELPPNNYPNNRSHYFINVGDNKSFKVKRNSIFKPKKQSQSDDSPNNANIGSKDNNSVESTTTTSS